MDGWMDVGREGFERRGSKLRLRCANFDSNLSRIKNYEIYSV